jgi:hypothetical protein
MIPPLPPIDAADILTTLLRLTGDWEVVKTAGDAIRTEAKARYKARGGVYESYGTPTRPFTGTEDMPGGPNNPLSEAEANALFQRLAAIKDIPFEYKNDGCFARAHAMCRIMQEQGVTSGKIWSFAVDKALAVPGTGITWGYHVAPIVSVMGSDGVARTMVFDPSLGSKPMQFGEWAKAQSGPDGIRLETTDAVPIGYEPRDRGDNNVEDGKIQTDPDGTATKAALDYFSIQRDLALFGL